MSDTATDTAAEADVLLYLYRCSDMAAELAAALGALPGCALAGQEHYTLARCTRRAATPLLGAAVGRRWGLEGGEVAPVIAGAGGPGELLEVRAFDRLLTVRVLRPAAPGQYEPGRACVIEW